jgi:hypothetical protein
VNFDWCFIYNAATNICFAHKSKRSNVQVDVRDLVRAEFPLGTKINVIVCADEFAGAE